MGNCGPVRDSGRAKWRAMALVAVHVVVAGHLAHWWLTGSTVTPVEPSEAMQTLERGYVNAGFVFFIVTLLLTLVFGRFFCGWACHVVALQDLCAHVLKKLKLKPKPVRSRLLAWIPLIAALYMFVWPTVNRVMRGDPAPRAQAHFTTRDFWETFPGPVVSVLTFVVCGFVVVWWLGAKGFCTYGCPYGGFFGVIDRVAPGRIVVNENCDGCAHCTAVCTSNVRVHEEVRDFKMVVDSGCMKCLDCVSVCPREALSFGFAKPALHKKPKRIYDFSWAEEIGLAAGFVLTFASLRGAYGFLPFLFSIGLGVLTASVTLVAWRLLRRQVLAWQHVLLKKNGKVTGAGRWLLAATALWLLFVAHTGLVNGLQWYGREQLNAAMMATSATGRDASRLGSLHALRRAESLGLFEDHRVHYDLAQHASFVGDFAEVEERLRRYVALAPRDDVAVVQLANVLAMRGPDRLAEAKRMLGDLLTRLPDHAAAKASLAAMQQLK